MTTDVMVHDLINDVIFEEDTTELSIPVMMQEVEIVLRSVDAGKAYGRRGFQVTSTSTIRR